MVLTLTRLVQVNVVNEEGQTALMWAAAALLCSLALLTSSARIYRMQARGDGAARRTVEAVSEA